MDIVLKFDPRTPVPRPGLENSGKKPQNRVLQVEYRWKTLKYPFRNEFGISGPGSFEDYGELVLNYTNDDI